MLTLSSFWFYFKTIFERRHIDIALLLPVPPPENGFKLKLKARNCHCAFVLFCSLFNFTLICVKYKWISWLFPPNLFYLILGFSAGCLMCVCGVFPRDCWINSEPCGTVTRLTVQDTVMLFIHFSPQTKQLLDPVHEQASMLFHIVILKQKE